MTYTVDGGTRHRLSIGKTYRTKLLAGQISERSGVNRKSRWLNENLNTLQRILTVNAIKAGRWIGNGGTSW